MRGRSHADAVRLWSRRILRYAHIRRGSGWAMLTGQGLDCATISLQNYRPGRKGGRRLSGRLAIVRAAHLHSYLAVMQRIGVPVESRLARSRLPPRIAETPDHYVSIPMAMEWIAQSCRDLEPMHLGLLGAQQSTLASLQPRHQTAVLAAPTGLTRLRALARIAQNESNGLRAAVQQQGAEVRVILDLPCLHRHPFICFAEWLNLQSAVSVVRSVAGASWRPRELTFVSRSIPPDAVSEAFPNTRILVGQPHASLLVARADLARASVDPAVTALEACEWLHAEAEHIGQTEALTLGSILRQIIQPYLNGGRTDLGFAAEILGMSMRTLQRRLQQNGISYTEILQEARFQFARTLLSDPGAKIIDVAMASGYDNPQHFSRAFRRFTGVTPTIYRQDLVRENELEAVSAVEKGSAIVQSVIDVGTALMPRELPNHVAGTLGPEGRAGDLLKNDGRG